MLVAAAGDGAEEAGGPLLFREVAGGDECREGGRGGCRSRLREEGFIV